MKFFPFMLKNLLRKKTRSALTLGSSIFFLFIACILGTFMRTLDSDPTGGKGMYRLIVRHKVSLTNFIPRSYEEKIRQLPGVKEISTFNWFGGMYKDQKPENMFARFGTEPEPFVRLYDEAKWVDGSNEEWFKDRSGAAVGKLLMKKYGWKVGDKIALKGDIYPMNLELTIRTVYEAPDETAIYFNSQAVEEGVSWAKGIVGTFWIKADSPETVSRLTQQIDTMFENTPWPTKTETEKEFQNGFISMLGNVKLMIGGIVSAIIFVLLLLTANTMALAARERVTEIAVLRTIGFQKSTILGLILGESVLLALIGGVAGCGVFALVFPGFREGLLASPMGGFAAGMRLFPEVLGTAFLVTFFVGIAAALFPAIRSAQRPITDGLRQVA